MAKSIIAQSAKERRMARILAEAEDRYRNELMEDSERMMLLDRIKRLRWAVETVEESVDSVHSGLDQL
jgi:hypothetical protein